jgi:CheY-like chemotaxis protein
LRTKGATPYDLAMAKKILIVDDDKLFLESLAAMLRNSGHSVIQAADGKQGFDFALETHPDLVITDIRMPVKTGLEMVDDLRNDTWGKEVPIIILSNDETTDAINNALESGVTVYLSKVNLDPDTLGQQILIALG